MADIGNDYDGLRTQKTLNFSMHLTLPRFEVPWEISLADSVHGTFKRPCRVHTSALSRKQGNILLM